MSQVKTPTAQSEISAPDSDRDGSAREPDTSPDALAGVAVAAENAAPSDARGDVDTVTEGDFDAIAAAAELDEFLAFDATAVGDEANSVRYVADLENDVQALNELVDGKDARIAELEAELEQSKVRLERDAQKQLELRTRKMLLGMIEVLDDLERALSSAREVDHNPDVVAGVELVHKRFLSKLGEYGITHLPSMGEVFDPAIHEAMAAVPTADASQSGKIIGVMREGYLIGEDVLRPAGVAVGKASS